MPSTEDAAAPAVLARQLSAAEKAGMLEVLSLVEEEEGALRDKGMSKFTFFFGLANLLLSAFLIGASPESFWIVYACQAVVIIGYRIYVEARRGKNTVDEPGVLLYFLDFCWVCNMFFAALSFVVLLEVLDDVLVSEFPALVERKPWLRPPELNFATQHPDVGRIFCLMATGPLGWSVIALNCKLVLHDIAYYSNTFIHLWPVLTTLSVRWDKGRRVIQAFPGHFESLAGFSGHEATLLELVTLGSKFYFVWWGTFTLWMLVHGRLQSPQKTGRDTVYLSLVRGKAIVRKLCGVREPSAAHYDAFLTDAATPVAVIKYMICHAIIVNLSLLSSAFSYLHIGLHAAFAVVCTAYSIYLGAAWYDFSLTKKYSRNMRKRIRSLHPEKSDKAKSL